VWFIGIDLGRLRYMEKFKLYDAEYKFTSLIWDYEPINSTELVRLCADKLGWKKSTTYTVLKKLCDRGILQNQDAVVTALVKREDVQKYESNAVIEKSFDGSLPKFLTSFLGERKITEQEAEELKHIIEEAIK
jgi:BlaI family penicillinase repressor